MLPILLEPIEASRDQAATFPPDSRPMNGHRAAALASYDAELFDTPKPDAFRRILRLAAGVYQLPHALIALADEAEIWTNTPDFKAKDVESLRALCLCSQVAATGSVFWVEDALRHPLLSTHPVVLDLPGVRFFAAAPILGTSGRVLGTLCLLDQQGRKYDAAARENLAEFAAMAADELELRREAPRRGQQAALPARVPGGSPLLSARDLKREQNEQARQTTQGQELLAATLASVTDGVIITDPHERIVRMNAVAESLTGHLGGEAAGRPIGEIFSVEEDLPPTPLPDTAPTAHVITHATVGKGNVHSDHQVWLWSRDGTRRRIVKSRTPVYDNGDVIGDVWVFRDISEQEKVAGELLKASKLESVGILAGGIAHDFNNLLTAIIGNLSLAKILGGEIPKVAAKLDAAERACYRARDLTGQLLTFARGGEPVKKLTSVDEAVRESIHFALHGSTVYCHFSLPDDLWPVEADIGQIGQVINNLGINAVQAMPRGGIIEVRAENIHLEPGGDAPPGLSPGQYVKICVEDDGTGISPEHLSKIFDPFFTTKETGTGLGLATSYSIIKKHGGHLSVDSVQGVGSIFRIFLPARPQQPVELVGNGPAHSGGVCARTGRSLRVLVMDDEGSVRDLAQSMLTYLGHPSVAEPDGESVVETFRQGMLEGRPFDLVILDLTVPGGMGGRDTLNHLRRLDPGVRAVVSSGYSNNPIMSDHRGHGFLGMLSKPYRVTDLADVLNEVFPVSQGA